MSVEKSPYELYRERVKERAASLPKAPKEIEQHILWLKSAAIERIENIEGLEGDKIFTFRVHNRKEITLSEAMKLDRSENIYKYGFSEHYVNLLMHYAYQAGKASNEESFKDATARMAKALEDIADIVSDFTE
jgi:hypothetical protein